MKLLALLLCEPHFGNSDNSERLHSWLEICDLLWIQKKMAFIWKEEVEDQKQLF